MPRKNTKSGKREQEKGEIERGREREERDFLGRKDCREKWDEEVELYI